MSSRFEALRTAVVRFLRSGDPVLRQTVAVTFLVELFGAVLLISALLTRSPKLVHPVFRQVLLPPLVDNGIWFAVSPVIVWVVRFVGRVAQRWYLKAGILLATSVALSLIHDGVALSLRTLSAADQAAFTLNGLGVVFWRECYSNQWMFWTTLAIFYGVSYYNDLQKSRVRAAELQTHLALAELENLRVQLQPHFLFNTLNTIASFVRQRPDEAENLIGDLCDLLRESLQTRSAQLVPLSQELATLERYLNIQKARFTDRITVEQSIAPEALTAAVPHLLLQPLVENAIRHGISHRTAGGHISIAATRDNKHVCLSVRDNGPGSRLPIKEGVGLSNTRNRLRQLYGPEHDFRVESDGPGFSVVLRFPFECSRIRMKNTGALA